MYSIDTSKDCNTYLQKRVTLLYVELLNSSHDSEGQRKNLSTDMLKQDRKNKANFFK